jgi:hypothetical protein
MRKSESDDEFMKKCAEALDMVKRASGRSDTDMILIAINIDPDDMNSYGMQLISSLLPAYVQRVMMNYLKTEDDSFIRVPIKGTVQ